MYANAILKSFGVAWLICVVFLVFLVLGLQVAVYNTFEDAPANAIDIGDTIEGYICQAHVADNQIYALRPNDDVMYLLTVAENYESKDFFDTFTKSTRDYVYILDVTVAQ